jgi:hypothetical protein
MKTLLLKTITIFAFALTFISCCNHPQGDPENIITEAEAQTMRNLFYENQYEFINAGLIENYPNATPDKSHITFELEDLKKFIYQSEQIAEDQNYSNLGLRIYLAAKVNEAGVPNTTVYMRTIGSPNDIDLPFPIRYDTLNPVPQSSYYNKGHIGGNGNDSIPHRGNGG